MNQLEKTLMHGLFLHPHHNTDKNVDFKAFKATNDKVAANRGNLLLIGPEANDDAGVIRLPQSNGRLVKKLESHCSPCVVRPFDSAATGVTGAARDIVAMGAEPIAITDFIGTMPSETKVLVGPCGFKGECTCGKCVFMASQERTNEMLRGIREACEAMDLFVVGGGFSTSFREVVPAMVISVIGELVTPEPLTKPAKNVGDVIILIGNTGKDGNDTAFRAGLAKEMMPAIALFEEERLTQTGTLAALRNHPINACSDVGAAGIGAAVCESMRYGGFGAEVDLSKMPTTFTDISHAELLINETQARMLIQVSPSIADEVINTIQATGAYASKIGVVTDTKETYFHYNNEYVATIPNKLTEGQLEYLSKSN